MVNIELCTQNVIYFDHLILSVKHWLTFLKTHSLAVFLDAYCKPNDSGLVSTVSSIISSGLSFRKKKSSLIIFTGLLSPFVPV